MSAKTSTGWDLASSRMAGAEDWAWSETARNSSNGCPMHLSIARRDLRVALLPSTLAVERHGAVSPSGVFRPSPAQVPTSGSPIYNERRTFRELNRQMREGSNAREIDTRHIAESDSDAGVP